MGIASRDSLRAWLHAPGSLSQRLALLRERFEVAVLRQRTAPLRRQELLAQGLPRRGCTTIREVILRVDGQLLVWARSALHQQALRGPWCSLRGLGNRPLAHLLYADRRVQRNELQSRRLARHGHTRRHAQRQWLASTGTAASAQMLWSCHSVFSRRGAQLRLTELFTPEMRRSIPISR